MQVKTHHGSLQRLSGLGSSGNWSFWGYIPHQSLIRPECGVSLIYVVEELEVVYDLHSDWNNTQDECSQINSCYNRAGLECEDVVGLEKERSDLEPGDNVVKPRRDVEHRGCARQVPTIAIEIHEAKCAMRHCTQ